LFEPDFSTMSKITQDAKKIKDFSAIGMEYISQYSQYWDKERKTQDMIKISHSRERSSENM
jgi:hypothetical protein